MSCVNCDSWVAKGFAENVCQENRNCFCVIGKIFQVACGYVAFQVA